MQQPGALTIATDCTAGCRTSGRGGRGVTAGCARREQCPGAGEGCLRTGRRLGHHPATGQSRAAATTIDPCQLVTRATAEAAAKTTLELLRQYRDVTGPGCEYSTDSSEVSVTITARSSGGGSQYDGLISTYGQGRTDVAGVGDKAFVMGQSAMYVLKGDTLIEVVLVSLKLNRDEKLAALTTMANSAVSHRSRHHVGIDDPHTATPRAGHLAVLRRQPATRSSDIAGY